MMMMMMMKLLLCTSISTFVMLHLCIHTRAGHWHWVSISTKVVFLTAAVHSALLVGVAVRGTLGALHIPRRSLIEARPASCEDKHQQKKKIRMHKDFHQQSHPLSHYHAATFNGPDDFTWQYPSVDALNRLTHTNPKHWALKMCEENEDENGFVALRRRTESCARLKSGDKTY